LTGKGACVGVSDRIEHSHWQVLRDRRLAVLLGGDLASKIGDGMDVVALPLLTLRIHGTVNPALAVALVSAAPYTLAVAVSLVFGLGRRRFRPRSLLMADCLVRFVVFTAVALLALVGVLPLWALGVALFAGSGLRLLALSSRRPVAAGLAGERGRFAVNGLLGTGDSLAVYIIGPVLGGVLATAVSPGFVLLLDGVSFLGLIAVVRGETGDQTGQESRSAGHRAATSVTAMDITIVGIVGLKTNGQRRDRHPGRSGCRFPGFPFVFKPGNPAGSM
jgi:hypothetical protein